MVVVDVVDIEVFLSVVWKNRVQLKKVLTTLIRTEQLPGLASQQTKHNKMAYK